MYGINKSRRRAHTEPHPSCNINKSYFNEILFINLFRKIRKLPIFETLYDTNLRFGHCECLTTKHMNRTDCGLVLI